MRLKSAARTPDPQVPAATPEVEPSVITDAADPDDQRPTVSAATPETTAAPTPSGAAVETRSDRLRRKAHRTRLQAYTFLAVVLFVFLVALIVSNTARVRVSWVFGSGHVTLVWLVIGAAILGWLLGVVTTTAYRWRTRAPRR